MRFPYDETQGDVVRGDLVRLRESIIEDLQGGRILIPQIPQTSLIRAGGVNHCPNSDLSFSRAAATVPGTLPATAGDANQECFRFFRQAVNANIATASVNSLKAVGHSGFAADEGVNLGKPRWDRINGWSQVGSIATQYDLAIQLPVKLVGPGQRWYVRFRCVALDAAIIPAGLQFFAGVWCRTAAGEGYASADPFTLGFENKTPGATSINYRVHALTDSGVEILSNVLNVPNGPNALSSSEYVKIFFANAGPGFIEFRIYREIGGVYSHLYTVRNSIDLQYNDDGLVRVGAAPGWPAVASGNSARAYAETRNIVIPPVGSTWSPFDLTIQVPATFNFSLVQSDGQFLRVGVTGPTGVNRHLAIDRIWFSTTYNEWAPDAMTPFPDGSFPVPTISPTEGNQGGGGGVIDPPPPGGGGGPCITTTLPVLVIRRDGGLRSFRKRERFIQYRHTLTTDGIKGRGRAPQTVLEKFGGTVSEYYVIKTRNGITYESNALHELFLDVVSDRSIPTINVVVGVTKLDSWVRGRGWVKTLVVSKELVREPTEVGSYTLRDPEGKYRDGKGIYIAGRSRKMDRGLPSRNVKPIFFGL